MKWLLLATMFLSAFSLPAQDVNKNPNKKEPPILGPHWTNGSTKSHNAGSNPDMTYHGGPVLPSATVKAIWWGMSWPSYSGDKITGIDKLYSSLSGTSYEATVDEYKDSAGHSVGSAVTYQGHVIDGSALPKHLSTSAVLNGLFHGATK